MSCMYVTARRPCRERKSPSARNIYAAACAIACCRAASAGVERAKKQCVIKKPNQTSIFGGEARARHLLTCHRAHVVLASAMKQEIY